MPSQDISLSVKSGTPITYPFDVYAAEFFILGQLPITAERTKLARFPLSFSMTNAMQDWYMTTKLKDASHTHEGYDLIFVEIQFARGSNQRFFSIFIVTLMWIMSFSMLALALTIILNHGTADSPSNLYFDI